MNSSVNIKELVPSFAEDFIELETEIFDRTKYYNYVSKHSKRIGLFSKYLNGKVHDSWIMKSNRLNESFTLELNDFSTHVFADAIIEKKGVKINHDKLIFPLEIKFLSTKDIQFYKIDENGFAFPIQIVEVDEYLYEEILAINEQSLRVAFQFWKNAKSKFNKRRKNSSDN